MFQEPVFHSFPETIFFEMARRDCNMYRGLYIAIIYNQDYSFSKSVSKLSLTGININFPDKLFKISAIKWQIDEQSDKDRPQSHWDILTTMSLLEFSRIKYTLMTYSTDFIISYKKRRNIGIGPDMF